MIHPSSFNLPVFRILRACALAICIPVAHANEAASTASSNTIAASGTVDNAKREAAATVTHLLADPAFADSLSEEFGGAAAGNDKTASLARVAHRYQAKLGQRAPGRDTSIQSRSAQTLHRLDQSLLAYKGIEKLSAGLLQVRLYRPAEQSIAPIDLAQVLVAYEPPNDDKYWRTVDAYDRQGNLYRLDARRAPDFPVLVIGVDGKEDLRAGLILANETLAAQGMQGALRAGARALQGRRAATPIDVAKLDAVSLSNDEEPWVSGAAEVYALVSGVQPSAGKAEIQLVELPYLQHPNKTYTPNQVLVYWDDFRFGAANVQLYEHDDNTNYKDLALALASGVTRIVGVFKPEFGMVAAVAQAVVQAMPSQWFTNDDDYLDSFYTLEKDRTYVNYPGAARNATITLTPYRLSSRS
ncbi:DUF3103 family protein [Trinickia caryophylli]|uniref:DUF3103 domain-containing protein n=1 Tax=Trinickia caryophylli TaxID=28094 RepID=A0A1X7GE08_TRICW|nr:DUF3103 family protein [Trinickia caryophylli]PMS10779.1 DUF3103 domain-containing protein [Trinickia caryophylli]TRX13845.1 DUF3103 family protein [Trinickia caryophylli]WQE15436.1 DUF3103 family protein [Trinickia caryophylli]SMF68295.1 Protein of unknown function [Trinickia caryophylli]GLU33827.1 hypothetical protein Busp01_36690 [Trinickia caryophylli]